MNVFKLKLPTCFALISLSASIAAAGQSHTQDESDVPPRRVAFPAPEHLDSLLPRSEVAESAAKERALERAVRFRRDTVELASVDKDPDRLYPLRRFSAESGRGSPFESRVPAVSAVLKSAPVAPSLPPHPRPASNR